MEQCQGIIDKEEMLGMHNLILLENICMQKTAQCMAHITFTLNKLTTQPAITKKIAWVMSNFIRLAKSTISWELNQSQSSRL